MRNRRAAAENGEALWENEINSISPTHPYYDQAVDWGEAWIRKYVD